MTNFIDVCSLVQFSDELEPVNTFKQSDIGLNCKCELSCLQGDFIFIAGIR